MIGNSKTKYVIFVEFKKNFKLICDNIIVKDPNKKIFTLWNFIKYFNLGSIIRLPPMREIIII